MSPTLKLSEAIRLGAMLKPKAACFYSVERQATCAMGAAADALGILTTSGLGSDAARANVVMEERWPCLRRTDIACPSDTRCGFSGVSLRPIIQHLNDDHDWTREQIADWVESVEAQQAEAAVDPVGEVAERQPTPRVEVLS